MRTAPLFFSTLLFLNIVSVIPKACGHAKLSVPLLRSKFPHLILQCQCINTITTKFFISLLFFVVGCKSQQYTFENLPQDRIEFGQGGGMAGGVKTYSLLENGQLFVYNSLIGESEELESASPEDPKAFFSELDAMSFKSIQFRHPGNRYYFLGRKSETGEHRTVWGEEGKDVPPAITELYRRLMGQIR